MTRLCERRRGHWAQVAAGLAVAATTVACGAVGSSAGSPAAGNVETTADLDAAESDVAFPTCGPAEFLATLPRQLAEASGIVRDPLHPGVFWLHNDSGNAPDLFAVDSTGALLAQVRIRGTLMLDAEDLAVARCDSGWCLFVADIGDNFAQRAVLQIHRVPLPAFPVVTDRPTVSVQATYAVRYPDGADDAETLVVDAERDELLIVTKGRRDTASLLVASLSELEGAKGRPVTLRSAGVLPVDVSTRSEQLLTGGDLSPDGKWLVVRSYEALHMFAWSGAEAFDPRVLPTTTTLGSPREPQGEGVGFAGDGRTLYLASEGRAGRSQRLSRVTCVSSTTDDVGTE